MAWARARKDSALLLIVLSVALLSGTSVTSLILVVTVAEGAGLRAALGGAGAELTAIDITINEPAVALEEVERAASEAIDYVLDASATASAIVFAQSSLSDISGLSVPGPVSVYFGDVDEVETSASLVDGQWPAEADAGDVVAVALPAAAAESVGLVVGDRPTVGATTVEIVGIYNPVDPNSRFWAPDLLSALGVDSGFADPSTGVFIPDDVIGPLVVAPRALEEVAGGLGVSVKSVDIRFQPDFGAIEFSDIGVVSDRLSEARTRVPDRIGDIGEKVAYSSRLSGTVDDAASSLLLTRTTVFTVAVLLFLVVIVSIAQTGRLVVDSRMSELRLLRARGVSPASIRIMAASEACVLGLLAAVVSPFLARLVYGAIAAHPASVAAGMPADAGLPPLVWAVSAGVSLAAAVALVAPLIPRKHFEDDGAARRAARGETSLKYARIATDIGIAALGVLMYDQLVTYRAIAGIPSIRIDSILVLAPAAILAACAILTIRLVPVIATAVGWLGSRTSGAVLSLAAWEVGRRASYVTTVALLLTLALGVGSFGTTFLATWRQSQSDQVTFAFGAPARVAADPASGSMQADALAVGSRGDPQPIIRRLGQVIGGTGGDTARGPEVQVLGLSATARSIIDRGRNGVEGGSDIDQMLEGDLPRSRSIALPLSARAVAATVRIDAGQEPFAGVSATVSAIIEDRRGLLITVALGSVLVDGAEHAVQGALPEAILADQVEKTGSMVGMVVDFAVSDRRQFSARDQPTSATVYVRDVAVVVSHLGESPEATVQPLPLGTVARWSQQPATSTQAPVRFIDMTAESMFGLGVEIPPDADSRDGKYSLAGWEAPKSVPVIVTTSLAEALAVRVGAKLTLFVSELGIPCTVVEIVTLVPGSSSSPSSTSSIGGDPMSEIASVVVIDQAMLSRALVGSGVPVVTVDEWWMDVATGNGATYLERHRGAPPNSGLESAEVVVLQQSEGPLRIATTVALWLVIGAAVLLAVTGFAVHTAASIRSRRTEFAQLRAIGLGRRSLVTVVAAEALFISAFGTVFGIVIGVLLGSTVASFIGISPDGSAPQPSVEMVVPVWGLAALVLVVVLSVISIVVLVAGRQRSVNPAAILRGANE